MEGWSRTAKVEAQQKSRGRQPTANRKAIEDEIHYLNDHPEESTNIAFTGTLKFEEWYQKTRASLLRVSRDMKLPITVRQEEEGKGLYFWKSAPEEVAARPRGPGRKPSLVADLKETAKKPAKK